MYRTSSPPARRAPTRARRRGLSAASPSPAPPPPACRAVHVAARRRRRRRADGVLDPPGNAVDGDGAPWASDTSTRAGSKSTPARRPSCAASKSTGGILTEYAYRRHVGRRRRLDDAARRPPAPRRVGLSCRAATSPLPPPLRHRARAAVWASLYSRASTPPERAACAAAGAAGSARPPPDRRRRPRHRSRARGDERGATHSDEGRRQAVDGDAATSGARRATRTR